MNSLSINPLSRRDFLLSPVKKKTTDIPDWLKQALSVKDIGELNKIKDEELIKILTNRFLKNHSLAIDAVKFINESFSSSDDLKRISDALSLVLQSNGMLTKASKALGDTSRRGFLQTSVALVASCLPNPIPGVAFTRTVFNIGFDPPITIQSPYVRDDLDHPGLIKKPPHEWYPYLVRDINRANAFWVKYSGIGEGPFDPEGDAKDQIAKALYREIVFRTKAYKSVKETLTGLNGFNELPTEDQDRVTINATIDGNENYDSEFWDKNSTKVLDLRRSHIETLSGDFDSKFDLSVALNRDGIKEASEDIGETLRYIREDRKEHIQEKKEKEKRLQEEKLLVEYYNAFKVRVTGVTDDPLTHKKTILDHDQYEAAYEWLLAIEEDLKIKAGLSSEES